MKIVPPGDGAVSTQVDFPGSQFIAFWGASAPCETERGSGHEQHARPSFPPIEHGSEQSFGNTRVVNRI